MNYNVWVDGKNVSYSGEIKDVISPLNEQKIGSVEFLAPEELSAIVDRMEEAQKAWGVLSVKQRAKVIHQLRNLLIRDKEEIADIIHRENGKTMIESLAAVDNAVEFCEYATSMIVGSAGGYEYVSRGVAVKEIKKPVGVVASIVPFNFPLMVPFWTLPSALVLGNAIIFKPSTATPLTLFKVAELLKEAGLPDGLFAVLPGNRHLVNAILDEPKIEAITFVGSTEGAKNVYQRGCHNLKRVLGLGGAKNFITVSPEANYKMAAKEICNAAFGMTGQRCMAASVVVTIGENKELIDEIVSIAKNLKVGQEMGPVIDRGAMDTIKQWLDDAKQKGQVLMNGFTDSTLPNEGTYVGPSIVKYNKYEDMTDEEIFGPTIEILVAKDVKEAIEFQNRNKYGNGASVYTNLGEVAEEFENGYTAGMIGVNIGVPVPSVPFAFGGDKYSKFGVGDITGQSSIEFFTRTRKVTTKWNPAYRTDWRS